MANKIRVTTHENGSRTSDEEDFSSIGAAVNHMVKMKKKETLYKIIDKLNKKISQAERKSETYYRHYQAVIEGLEEALLIVEKEL